MFERRRAVLVVPCVYFIESMTNYLNFYIIVYIITLWKLSYLLNSVFGFEKLSTTSYIILYVLKFSKLKHLILLNILSLTGLPPFLIFFIKFNYLVNVLHTSNFFVFFFIFIILFINMIFYIQIFFFKHTKNFKILKKTTKSLKIRYKQIYSIVFFLFFNFFSVFFFADFFFILKLI